MVMANRTRNNVWLILGLDQAWVKESGVSILLDIGSIIPDQTINPGGVRGNDGLAFLILLLLVISVIFTPGSTTLAQNTTPLSPYGTCTSVRNEYTHPASSFFGSPHSIMLGSFGQRQSGQLRHFVPYNSRG